MDTYVRIQENDFSIDEEIKRLRKNSSDIGAIVSFLGLVRENDFSDNPLRHLELEHYLGMSEKRIEAHVKKAGERWPIQAASVIHRVGRLALSEQIVAVIVASKHRKHAFEASEFIMDYLKSDAPFWKKHIGEKDEQWIDAKESDQQALSKWDK
jgi:molybdopterin synthase catalytic subunit